MKHMEDLKITGIDNNRPPIISKKPYIDLVFSLSEKAAEQWCKDFNASFKNDEHKAKISLENCIHIESWVKTMDKIPAHLEALKIKVAECNILFNDQQNAIAEAASNSGKKEEDLQGPQGQLNQIISKLDFN